MISYIQNIFEETTHAFQNSDIKTFAESNGQEWFYSISATKLSKGNNLIVGFNWGASLDFKYKPQTIFPENNFKQLYVNKELGSLQRIYEPLKKYFPETEVDEATQTNFCFFRSKKENQISQKDLELSIPLFLSLLDHIQPKRIISFSKKLQDYITGSDLGKDKEYCQISSNKKTLIVAKGNFVNKQASIPIYFLPHPNSRFTSEARNKAWEFCFKKG